MRRLPAALLWTALLALPACSGDGSSKKTSGCVGSDAGLDCGAMCRDYCNKLRDCGVSSSSTCVDDCRTVTEAGASTESYQCVNTKPCSDISNCGI